MKKQATPEQKAKAEARRERFRGLCKKLAEMSDSERAELTAKVGAVLTCEGHPLSLRNTLLLMLQHPTVSVVGGFRQWIRAGRVVRKGEVSSMIWIPSGRKSEGPGPAESEPSLADMAADAAESRPRFLTASVFDVTQTEELSTAETGAALEGVEA